MRKPRLRREDMNERCRADDCRRSLITDRERAWGLCGKHIVERIFYGDPTSAATIDPEVQKKFRKAFKNLRERSNEVAANNG